MIPVSNETKCFALKLRFKSTYCVIDNTVLTFKAENG